MASSKRPRWSPEWYVVSKRTIYTLVASVLGLAGLIGGGYWLYQYLNENIIGVEVVGRQSARFIQIEGKVRVKRANSTEFNTATEKMELEAGDTIQTQSDSVARVQFVDGSSYTIKPDTTLVIKDNTLLQDNKTQVHVTVDVGTVNLATGDQRAGSSNVVQTDSASAKVGGNTEASVEAGEGTAIQVAKGNVNIRTKTGETIEAGSNERLNIENTGRLISREMMLPVPALQAPENQRLIRLERGRPSAVSFNWAAIPQARSYRIEVATSAHFKDTVVANRDQLNSPSAVIDKLPPGSYYWHVRATDEKGQAGEYSEPFKFTLVGGAARRTLSISVARHTWMGGNSFIIEGHTEPGTRVKVGSVAARVEPNGDFKAFVTLGGGAREVLIVAEDQDGNTGQKLLRL